jgi:hypothetical protein
VTGTQQQQLLLVLQQGPSATFWMAAHMSQGSSLCRSRQD